MTSLRIPLRAISAATLLFIGAKGYLLAADRDALIAQAEASDVCNQPGDGGRCDPGP